jgi:prephenate dehydratase
MRSRSIYDLLIVREIVIDIEHCLLARPGTARRRRGRGLYSIPVATAQCHHYLRERPRPTSRFCAAYSTADAARMVSERVDARRRSDRRRGWPRRCTGSTCSPGDIADHEGNQTRFVVVARGG